MAGNAIGARAVLIIVVVWASSIAFTRGSKLQLQPQWRAAYGGHLASGPHLRGGKQSLVQPRTTVGKQLGYNYLPPDEPLGSLLGKEKFNNQGGIAGNRRSNQLAQQSVQGRTSSGFRSSINPARNSGISGSKQGSRLGSGQNSLLTAQRTPPSIFRPSNAGRRSQSIPKQAQSNSGGRQPDIAIIEDIRDGPHADGSYYFKYSQTDGTVREEGGEPVAPCELRVTGNYYYQAPNGEIIHREYVADGLGHREFPPGTRSDIYSPPRRVPVAPPMPAGGMPPCDDGQYRPTPGPPGPRPQKPNPSRPNPPWPNPTKPNPPISEPLNPTPPKPSPQNPYPPKPTPQKPSPPNPYPPKTPPPKPSPPNPYPPNPTPPKSIPPICMISPTPQQPYLPPTQQPQPTSYLPQPQPQPPITNPSPLVPALTPQYGNGGNANPGTGLDSGQNPGSIPGIYNINTQNNDNSQRDIPNVLNFNAQNNYG